MRETTSTRRSEDEEVRLRVERMRRWVKDANALADQINERRLKEGLAEPINAVELLEGSRRD